MAETSRSDPSAFRAFELAGWDLAARAYADHWTGLTGQAIASLLDAVGVRAGAMLLDVASGPGEVAAAAARCGARVLGVDFSPAMVALARRAHPGLRFVIGDAEALPLRDACCDAVVMNFGMLHLAQPEVAVRQAHRVLRRGGRFAFTVWATPDQTLGFAVTLEAIREYGDPQVPVPEGPPFFRFAERDACVAVLRGAGFRNPRVETLPLRWRLPNVEAAFVAMHEGTARTGGLLRRQTREALVAIRAAMECALAPHVRDGAVELPMPAVLASATA